MARAVIDLNRKHKIRLGIICEGADGAVITSDPFPGGSWREERPFNTNYYRITDKLPDV